MAASAHDRHVETSVSCICSSFVSGLDVLRSIHAAVGKDARKEKKKCKADGRREKLVKSLRRGPEEVGAAYARGYDRVGPRFEIGDVIAQATLAEVLLRLNAGIASLIQIFLTRNNHDVNLDYDTATVLSENARLDTCRALHDLNQRMRSTATPIPRSVPTQALQQHQRRPENVPVKPKSSKIRGPTLARVIVNGTAPSSQIAMVRPGRKKKASSTLSSAKRKVAVLDPKASASSPDLVSRKVASRPDAPGTNTVSDRSDHATASPARRSPPPPYTERQPLAQRSTPRADATAFSPSPTTSRLSRSSPPAHNYPSPPQLHPQPLRPTPTPPNVTPSSTMPPRRRRPVPTPTLYSTASTRLGEIPLHRWAEPPDFDAMSVMNREAARDGWPLTEFEHVEPRPPTRRGFWGLFGGR